MVLVKGKDVGTMVGQSGITAEQLVVGPVLSTTLPMTMNTAEAASTAQNPLSQFTIVMTKSPFQTSFPTTSAASPRHHGIMVNQSLHLAPLHQSTPTQKTNILPRMAKTTAAPPVSLYLWPHSPPCLPPANLLQHSTATKPLPKYLTVTSQSYAASLPSKGTKSAWNTILNGCPAPGHLQTCPTPFGRNGKP